MTDQDQEFTDASGGSDVQPQSSALRKAISMAGKAAAGIFIYRAVRSSRLGRELTTALAEDLRSNRILRTIAHAALPFTQARDAGGMPIQDMAMRIGKGELRSLDIRLSGLTGLGAKTRTRLEHELARESGLAAHELPFGERLDFEKLVFSETWAGYKKQVKAIWDFYGEPGMHRKALGGSRYPAERMSRFDRYAWEAALAARHSPVRDAQVLSEHELTRTLGRTDLSAEAKAHLEKILALRKGAPDKIVQAALSGSERFGHSSPTASHDIYRALIEDAASNPLFRRAPKLGVPEGIGSSDTLTPETFQDVVRRMQREKVKVRRFQTVEQGQAKFVEVPIEAYQHAIEAAGGAELYTGRFIDPARGHKRWDPYEASLRGVAFSGLKALSHFRIPLLGFSPAQMLKPKELEQWYGEGRMVQPIHGGRQIWVADGRRHDGWGWYQGGKLLEAEFGLLDEGPIGKVQVDQLKATAALFDRKLKATKAAAIASGIPENLHGAMENLDEAAVEQLLAEATGDIKPSLLKQALWEGRASQAVPVARLRGMRSITPEGKAAILTPGEGDIARFIAAIRGERMRQPLPGEILPFAQDQTEPLYNDMGELVLGRSSRWAKGVSGTITGLSKLGIDWRNQPEKPMPLKLIDMVAGMFGKGPSVLHVEDYGVSWASALTRTGGEFKSAWHGNYERLTSSWAENYMLDLMEGAGREGGVFPWSGLRMEPVAIGRARATVEPDRLAQAISDAAEKAVKDGDWKAYKALFRQTVATPGGFAERYQGKVAIEGIKEPVAFEWKTRVQTVLAQKSEWMVASGDETFKGSATWLAARPLAVLGEIGVGGFDETAFRSPWDPLRAMAKRSAAFYYGYQALQYADYQIENLTGVSPIKTMVGLGAGVDLGRHAVMTPFIYGAKALEAIEPGSIDSPFSYIARTLGPLAIGGAMSFYMKNPVPLIAGAAASFFLSGDLTKTAGEMSDIYSGEESVPIRRGRWWGMSDGSFFGDDIVEWRPHWVARTMMDAKYKGYPYKDKRQYWETQMGLPVPENWFGLRGLLHPYEHDEYLQTVGAPTVYSSPHPITQIPVIGPLLTPLGYLLKPPRMMHPELGLPTEPAEEAAAREALTSIATRNNLALADEGLAAPPSNIEGPYSWRGALRKMLRYAEELPGLYGWATGAAVRGSLGIREGGTYHYETAADDVSTGADYWEMELGGLGGLTEFWRRLFPRPRSGEQAISNVPNQMPSWLPSGEDMRGKDFHTGNPFAKLPMGELILPGKGYEARRPELRGVDPENYPAWARLEVLTSAAPFSTQARLAAEELAAGLDSLDGKLRKRAETLLGQYMETSGDTLMRSVEDPDLGWATTPLGVRASKLFGNEGSLSGYVRRRLLGSSMERWEDPIETIAAPAYRYAGYTGGPLGGALTGAVMGAVFGGNPISAAIGAAIGGAAGFFTGARASSYARRTGSVWMTEEAKKRMQVTDYFDRLRFVKATSLYKQTRDPVFLEAASQTMYGNDPFSETWHVLSSLPEQDRRYVQSFLQVEGASDRSKILKATPGYIDRVLEAQWAMQDAASGKLSYKELEALKQVKTASWLQNQVRLAGADPDLEGYFSRNYLPQESWSGWAMDAPLESAKLKVVENEGLDAAELGIWQSERSRYERQMSQPLVPDMGTPTPGGGMGARRRLRDLLQPENRQFESVTQVESDRDRAETYIEVERSPYREVRALMRYGL